MWLDCETPAGAHPRLRGADGVFAFIPPPGEGSSPLTRGGLRPACPWSRDSGLIPAYAGRTGLNAGNPLTARAHPRLRGADADAVDGINKVLGSSPLTRGGPGVDCGGRTCAGLIPAYAGRTMH